MSYLTSTAGPVGFSTESNEADLLLRAHDGDVALLYLFSRSHPNSNDEQAAGVLCRTLSDIHAAQEKLQRMGFTVFADANTTPRQASAARKPTNDLPGAAPGISPPATPSQPEEGRKIVPDRIEPVEQLPEYSSDYLAQRQDSDVCFQGILEEGQKAFGRILSTPEIQMLLGIYEYLALPAEVVLVLLNYCAGQNAEKGNGKRRLSARAVEQEAYHWARLHIDTLEAADEYISRNKARQTEAAQVAEILGITGRPLSATELKYVNSWLDSGFESAALSIAYDRTLLNTCNFSWPYMNGILENWKSRNLFTAAEIVEKDTRAPSSKNSSRPQVTDSPQVDVSKLNSLLDLI